MANPLEIFISYSHKDENLRDELSKHLALLRRQGIVRDWHDRRIGAGEDWKGTIDEHLNRADIIILLISADFIASDYCYDLEMKRSLERNALGEARVIPVILRACDWIRGPFGSLQALPRDGKPVTSWANRDEAWTNIAYGIRAIVDRIVSVSSDLISPTQPVLIQVARQSRDEEASKRLTIHLTSLMRPGLVNLKTNTVDSPDQTPESTYEQFIDAEIIIIFLSQEFLNSSAATHPAVETLLSLSAHHQMSVLPIVLRECDWRASAFANFPVLPHDGCAIENGYNDDERWQEIARAINLLVHSRIRVHSHPMGSASPPPSDAKTNRTEKVKSLQVGDVYTTVGFPEVTFVVPTAIPQLMQELRVRGRVLIIEGPSGIGKSVATEYALKQLHTAGKQAWPQRWLRAKRREIDLPEILALPRCRIEDIVGHLVIDDFQMLAPEDRERLGDFAKAFADGCRHDAKITFIGINYTRASLIDSVPDLGTRAIAVRLGRESDDKIIDLISKGEHALNVQFANKAEFALCANGSFVVAQMLCEQAMLMSDIQETQRSAVSLNILPPTVIRSVAERLRSQFHKSLQLFALLDSDYSGLRGAAIALLWHLGHEPIGSISISDVRPQLGKLDGSLDVVLSQIQDQRDQEPLPSWRQLLDCDPMSGQLALDDPKLGFYLRHLDWVRLGQVCGIKLKRTVEGEIQFMDVPGAKTNGTIKSGDNAEVRILHLSDLHFTERTAWDADTVLDRLVRDIAYVSDAGRAPDLIIVTGDVAFSGKTSEYFLAREWLLGRLLPAAKLGPPALVIVPGNHDVDRTQVSRSARALHRELLESRRQPDIAQALADPRDRTVLLSGHDAFTAFLSELQASGRIWDLPWGAVTVQVRGVRVHIAALCSSLLSSADSDHGLLLLGLRQVNEAFQGADGADIVISAMHHPWTYFADFDRVSQSEVHRSASLVLRGHLHETSSMAYVTQVHGGVVELAAGASYESSEGSLSYQFVTLNMSKGKVFVHPRCWDKVRREWIADLNQFQGERGEFPLRRAASHKYLD
jgi:3',5'-cyclic AMP phosphodiesterase CpdA